MPAPPRWFDSYSPLLLFGIALPLLFLRFGHWFYLSIDEGISLEGARRVAAGEVPYRDFFAVTGPGASWLLGAVFHGFGATFAHARALLCCELAASCALVCAVTRRVTGPLFAFAAALLFLAMLLTTPYPVYLTHRWESNLLALLAVALAAGRRGRYFAFAAGASAGLAGVFTPSMLAVALALAIWVVSVERPSMVPFTAGVLLPLLSCAAVLLAQNALGDFAQAMWWDAAHYSGPNRMSYGALTDTLQYFLRRETYLSAWIHRGESLLPAMLPIAALAAIGFLAIRRAQVPRGIPALLGLASIATLAACYPRFGAAQLLFGSAIYWVVCGAAVWLAAPARARVLLTCGVFVAAAGVAFAGRSRETLKTIDTPAGTLQVSMRHHILLNDLQASIRPGDKVFVYPYLPILYFTLKLDNPTRYLWLQPGMMQPDDEQAALADLKRDPPHWVVWHDFPETFILKNWPASDRRQLRFPPLEGFFEANYHAVEPDGVAPIGYRLLERNP